MRSVDVMNPHPVAQPPPRNMERAAFPWNASTVPPPSRTGFERALTSEEQAQSAEEGAGAGGTAEGAGGGAEEDGTGMEVTRTNLIPNHDEADGQEEPPFHDR